MGFSLSNTNTGTPALLTLPAKADRRVLLPDPESPVKAMTDPTGKSGSSRYLISRDPHSRIDGTSAMHRTPDGFTGVKGCAPDISLDISSAVHPSPLTASIISPDFG